MDDVKAFDYVDHNKLWKILQEMGIPDHLNCLLRNLYVSQEATVRIGHGITVQFSPSVVSNSLRPHKLQYARPHYPSPTPRVYSNSCPLSWWCHPTISSSVVPSPLAFNVSQHQGLFQWVSSSHQVAKGLEFQLQHQPFQWIFKTDFL